MLESMVDRADGYGCPGGRYSLCVQTPSENSLPTDLRSSMLPTKLVLDEHVGEYEMGFYKDKISEEICLSTLRPRR